MKKRKIKIIFASLSCVLAILAGTFCVSASDPPLMFSNGLTYTDEYPTFGLPGNVYFDCYYEANPTNPADLTYTIDIDPLVSLYYGSEYSYSNINSVDNYDLDDDFYLFDCYSSYSNFDVSRLVVNDDNNLFESFTFDYGVNIDSWGPTPTGNYCLRLTDFFVWSEIYNTSIDSGLAVDLREFNQTSLNWEYYSIFRFDHMDLTYYCAGDNTEYTHTITGNIAVDEWGSDFDQLDFRFELKDFPEKPSGAGVIYVKSADIYLVDPEPSDLDVTLAGGFPVIGTFNPYAERDFYDAFLPFDSENPAVPLIDYTAWLGEAASGFLDLHIFPHFTVGGLLMTIIAFSCAIWFLKVFAGG